jgi:uncharacterized repeat protein (TIGR02543 family)
LAEKGLSEKGLAKVVQKAKDEAESSHLFRPENGVKHKKNGAVITVGRREPCLQPAARKTTTLDLCQWWGSAVPATPARKLNVQMKITRTILLSLLLGALVQTPSALAQITSGMAFIPPGSFTMGDPLDGEPDATPAGTVTVSGFYMDTNLVSSNVWSQVYLWAVANGYSFLDNGSAIGPNYPVQTVVWYDVVLWCNARSEQAGLPPVYYNNPGFTQVYRVGGVSGPGTNVYANWANLGYRLPTEAEWEKAARGGLVGLRFPWPGITISESQANYDGSPFIDGNGFSFDLGPSGENTDFTFNASLGQGNASPVGFFTTNANGYGLYDVAGNVFEWCWDFYAANYYNNFPLTDPHGPASGGVRVVRGGAYDQSAYDCRVAYRGSEGPISGGPDLGFRTVLPVFAAVTVQASPAYEGVVTGGGAFFSSGNSVTNTATANSGYQFINWTSNGVVVSTANNYVVTVTTNDILTANFATAQYTIALASSPSLGGTVSGGGSIQVSNSVTATATPNPGYTFTDWTTNGIPVSSANPYSFTVFNDEALTAVFTPIDYTITTNAIPSADGSVSGASGSIPYGTLVTNFATPNSGFQFVNWTVGGNVVSTVTNYAYTVTGDETLTANFNTINFTLTVIPYPSGYGSVSGGGTFPFGTLVTNTAITNGTDTFVSWTINGAQVSTATNYTLTVTTNELLIANFAPPGSGATITLIAYPTTGGTVSGGGTVFIGALVTNTATANSGSQFANWTVNDVQVSTANPYTFTAESNELLVANFTNPVFAVESVAVPSTGGTVTSVDGAYPPGSFVTNFATTNSGYQFVNWTSNGVSVSTSTNYIVTVTTNEQLIANFSNTLVITSFKVIAYADVGGNVANPGGTFATGSSVTNTATANSGYQFANWTINGVVAATTPTYSFTVTTNVALVANFTPNAAFTLTVIPDPSAGGTVSAGGTFASGTEVINSAAANSGYQFVNWTSTNGSVLSSFASFPVTLTTNEILVANFAPVDYTITVTSSPTNGPAASMSGTFPSGSSATFTTSSNSGYEFVKWTSNGTQVSTSTNYLLTIAGNETLVANFSNTEVTITALADPGIGGTVSSGGGTFLIGSSVTNTATANSGYSFVSWSSNGVAAGSANPYVFTASTNVIVIGNFAANVGDYTLTVVANPTDEGAVSGVSGLYPVNSLVTNTATPDPGYQLVSWTSNGIPVSASTTYVVAVSNDVVLVGNFAPLEYTITVTSSPSNGPAASMSGTFAAGSAATFTALTNTGYEFVDWTVNGTVESVLTDYTFTVSGNETLVANFSGGQNLGGGYTVTVSPSPGFGGSVTGGGNYAAGSLVTNTATASNGFVFTGWTGSAIITGTNNPLVVTVNSNLDITANFAATTNSGGLTLTVLTSGGGTVLPNLNGKVLTAGTYTLTATPDDIGNVFSSWTGTITTNTNPLIVTLTTNMVLQANFGPNPVLSEQGTYNGLFSASNGVTAQTAGMLKGLTIGPSGTYSGTLSLGGSSYAITGGFSADAQATNQISRPATQGGPLTLAMTLSGSNNVPEVTGTVSGTVNGAAWTANLTAYVSTVSPSSGQYTILIPPDAGNNPPTSSPGGYGYVLITNDMGSAKLTVALADGTVFTQTTPVSEEDYVPIYSTLYRGKGLLLGWVNLDAINTNGVGLTWIFPGRTSGEYQSGFTNVLLTNQLMLSPWTNAPENLNLLTNLLVAGSITASNASPATVSINTSGQVTGTGVRGNINLRTGQLTLSIGSGKSAVTAHGAILLNTNLGGGYLATPTNAQAIRLTP